jgi:integrase
LQALTKAELLALLGAARAHSERDYLMILVAYCHGLRRSELVAIKRDNIQDDYLVIARGKHSNPCNQRLVSHVNPLLDERTALLRFIAEIKAGDRVFPVTGRQFYRIVKRHAITVDLPPHKWNCHQLKHTLGSEIYEKTKDLELVQLRLGHKEESSSLIYSKRATEIKADAETERLLNDDRE